MNAFWLGVTIALIAEFSDWLYAFFTFDSFWARVRVFLYWLPSNITLAFAAGFISELLQARQNQSALAVVAVACFGFNLLMAYILERNGFILRRLWQDWSADALRAKSRLLYSTALVVSLIPYAVFFRETAMFLWMIVLLIGLLVLQFAFHNKIWDFLHSFEGSIVRERLERLIKALCHRCVVECPFFLDESPNVLGLLTHSREELISSLSATNDLLQQIMRFSPLDSTDRPLPGLSEEVLPPRRIKAIAKEVQSSLLTRLELRKHIVHVLVGDAAAAAEAKVLIANAIDADVLVRLEHRRAELFAGKAAESGKDA